MTLHGGACPCCHGRFKAVPPAGLEPGSPFGPNLRAFVLYLRFAQAIPFARLADPVERHLSPALPMIGAGEPVDAAVGALEKADAAVVLTDGKPEGVLTRQDLLTYLAAP